MQFCKFLKYFFTYIWCFENVNTSGQSGPIRLPLWPKITVFLNSLFRPHRYPQKSLKSTYPTLQWLCPSSPWAGYPPISSLSKRKFTHPTLTNCTVCTQWTCCIPVHPLLQVGILEFLLFLNADFLTIHKFLKGQHYCKQIWAPASLSALAWHEANKFRNV